jgi:hypothetical protein
VLEQELQRNSELPADSKRSATNPPDLLRFRANTSGNGSEAEEGKPGPSRGGSGSGELATGLTLLRMKAWLQEPIERFGLLHESFSYFCR